MRVKIHGFEEYFMSAKEFLDTLYSGNLYGASLECEDDIKRLVVECIDTARNALISTKKTMEDAALEKFRKRFENEIEPALTRMSGRMAELISKGEFDNELEKMAREELIYALRRRAEEWAKKVASSEVRFKFDEIYD